MTGTALGGQYLYSGAEVPGDEGIILGSEMALTEERVVFREGPTSPPAVVYTRMDSPPVSPMTDLVLERPGVSPYIPHLPTEVFSIVELETIRQVVADTIKIEIAGGFPPHVYRESVNRYKGKVNSLEEKMDRTIKAVTDNHQLAGNKYAEVRDIVSEMRKEELAPRVKSLEDYRDLIETRYSGVHPDVSRDIWHNGFNACLQAIVSRGSFDTNLLDDQSFMRQVRNKDALFKALDNERAKTRRANNAKRWAERKEGWNQGTLPMGKEILGPGSANRGVGIGRGRGSLRDKELAAKITAEKEERAVKMFDDLENASRVTSTGGAIRTEAVEALGASSVAATITSIRGRTGEILRGSGSSAATGPVKEAEVLKTATLQKKKKKKKTDAAPVVKKKN